MASSTPPPPPGASTGQNGKVKSQPFEDTYRHFFESLSPKEQLLYSPCASHGDFIKAMRKLEVVANQHRKRNVSRIFDRIARFSDQLQPFFKVVNIMIQSNPEYTALAWGALLFILQLASGFRTFLEKLIATLERFCDEIPQYEHLWDLVKPDQGSQISAGIQECTEKVYGLMFQFFREVSNVFTSGGRIKRTPVVIADILWRPFENRFDGILKQVRDCRSLIKFDIALLHARIAKDTKAIAVAQKEIAEKEQEQNRKAQEKADGLAKITDEIARTVSQSYREQVFERIQKWLSPPQYSDALLRGKSLREPGTNEWILTNTRFCEWREREWSIQFSEQRGKTGRNILWIKGNPGSGKSVLASSVIDELTAAYRQDSQIWELCYFFFTTDCKESITRISAYRSILAQILHRNRQDEDTINKFNFIMTDPASSGTPKAGLDELFGLVKLLFQQFQILLVLDGIDECEDNSPLIGEIMELSESSSAKILLCGRTSTESLIRTVPTSSQIRLDSDKVNADIRLSISTQVDLLSDDGLLPPGSNSEDLVNHLCRGADGMFLWAKLMFKYLGLPVHDPYSRLKIIRSVLYPEGLEEMYARIVRAISQAGKTSRGFASRILAWASYSMRPLTLEELYDFMTADTSNTMTVDSNQLRAFQEKVCIVCKGLIEFSEVPNQPTAHRILRYIHLSVKEHFSQGLLGLEARDLLVSSEAVEHLACARQCLEYLLYHFSTRQGQLGHSGFTDPPLGAFSGYAARSWVIHLDHSFSSPSVNVSDISSALSRLASSLSNFLQDSTKVKFWIHVLYNHSNPRIPDGLSSSLDELALTLSGPHCFPASMGNLLETMKQFCQDVSKALNAWDNHLRRSTDILWDEMAIFSESPFMAGPSKGKVMSMAPKPPSGSIYANFSLICKISHTSLDGEMTAVVSTWQNPRSWTESVVKYELWKHNIVPTRLSEIINYIEHQQTVNMYLITISDDLRSFAVMDRLFVLATNGNEATISTRSTKIPVRCRTYPTDPHTTFFKLSTRGRFLFSSDSSVAISMSREYRTCIKITMSEIENEGPLEIKPILHKDFQYGEYPSIVEAVFHPSHNIVIIRGGTWIAAWNFAKEIRDQPESSFELIHSGMFVDNMALSSCGRYVVLGCMSKHLPQDVISIPDRFFAPGLPGSDETYLGQSSDSRQEQSTMTSLFGARQGNSALLSPGRPIKPNQILTRADGTPAHLIAVQGGEEVRITKTSLKPYSNSTDEAINIIRLPQGQGMNEVAPTILAPAPGDESVKMILDEKRRGGQRQPNELPIFISRGIDAINHTFRDGGEQHVDVQRAAGRQRIQNREESEREQVINRRRTGTIRRILKLPRFF